MNNKADIGLVDPHAKSNGRTNHPHVVAQKQFLVSRTRLRVETGVVRLSIDSIRFQARRHALSVVPALTVNNSAITRSRVHKAQQLFVRTLLRQNAISEIGTIEAGHVTFRLAQTKLFDDVTPYAWGGSRGQRHQGSLRKQLAQLSKLPILGTKVMSPLADAMRFVNRDLIDVPVFQIRKKAGEHQTLWRNI